LLQGLVYPKQLRNHFASASLVFYYLKQLVSQSVNSIYKLKYALLKDRCTCLSTLV